MNPPKPTYSLARIDLETGKAETQERTRKELLRPAGLPGNLDKIWSLLYEQNNYTATIVGDRLVALDHQSGNVQVIQFDLKTGRPLEPIEVLNKQRDRRGWLTLDRRHVFLSWEENGSPKSALYDLATRSFVSRELPIVRADVASGAMFRDEVKVSVVGQRMVYLAWGKEKVVLGKDSKEITRYPLLRAYDLAARKSLWEAALPPMTSTVYTGPPRP